MILTFFLRFPNNKVLPQRWILTLGENSNYNYKYKRVCSRHFTLDSFLPSCSKAARLKPDAVPKIVVKKL